MIFTLLSLSTYCNNLAGLQVDKLSPPNILFIQQNCLVFNLYVSQKTKAIFETMIHRAYAPIQNIQQYYGNWVHIFVLEITVGPSDSFTTSQSHMDKFTKQVNPPTPPVFSSRICVHYILNTSNPYECIFRQGTPQEPRNRGAFTPPYVL